ncbi:MAG TPA: 3-hydroxyacyl-ACP dehydratase FabZ [Acidimicrobiales bacterium]|nr:3-hydroxyacyl-ACP dehydratase FabZ [Acidimicrobiales bacterium]
MAEFEVEAPSLDYVALLPHRPPFLFVDVVDTCEPGKSCTGRYRVTGDEEFLRGHFPGNPVVPGVIQLEALAQVGAVAVRAHPDFADRLPLFGGVEKARFRRMVLPGHELALSIVIERLSSRGGWGDARATVDGNVVCDARLFFTFPPRAAAAP